MGGRVVNVLIPRQLGIVTDELTGESGAPRIPISFCFNLAKMPWASLLVYVFLRFMQGNMGLIGALRSYCWIPIGQVK
jgi:ATP-binding cassette, subfamily B, vacuolar membrane transporter HMT1/ACLQ